jgi:hypothetical protein
MAISILQPLATYGSEVLDESGSSVFILDATTNEGHDTTVDITEHPVEDGADLTDHARVKPFELTITGVITNTPIAAGAQVVPLSTEGFDFTETRVQATYGLMLELANARGLLTVITGLRTYENMMLRSVRIVRTGPGKQEILPQLEFKEIRIAQTAFVTIPAGILAARTKASGQSKQDKEQQASKDADKEELIKWDDNKTRLANITNNAARLSVALGGPGS